MSIIFIFYWDFWIFHQQLLCFFFQYLYLIKGNYVLRRSHVYKSIPYIALVLKKRSNFMLTEIYKYTTNRTSTKMVHTIVHRNWDVKDTEKQLTIISILTIRHVCISRFTLKSIGRYKKSYMPLWFSSMAAKSIFEVYLVRTPLNSSKKNMNSIKAYENESKHIEKKIMGFVFLLIWYVLYHESCPIIFTP